MTKIGTIVFTGVSGKKYEFNIYPWGTDFTENYEAVYFITRREANNDGGYSHTRIYVGQTEDLSIRFDNHHKQTCFDKYNKNCVCVFGEKNEKTRLEIEKD